MKTPPWSALLLVLAIILVHPWTTAAAGPVNQSLPPIVGPPVLPETPTVSVEATVPEIFAADGKKGVFTVRRTGVADDNLPALTVTYRVGGTATGGVQYQILTGFITLAAGQTEARVKVRPLAAGTVNGGDTTVKITLDAGVDYVVGDPGKAKLRIHTAAP